MVSGSIYTLGSTVVLRAATVINAIVIIRVLGPNDYGILAIIMLIIAIAGQLSHLQVPTAIVKFLSSTQRDRPDEASELIGSGLIVILCSTAASVAVICGLSPVFAFSIYQEPRLQGLIPIAALSMAISSVTSPFLATFQGFELIKELGVRNASAAVLSVPSTLILVLSFGLQGAVFAAIVNSAISILVNVALLRRIWLKRGLKMFTPRRRTTYERLLGYALPSIVSGILVALAMWFSNTMLRASSPSNSFVEVGRFSAGYGLAGYVFFISAAIGVPLIPMVSRLQKENPDELPHFMTRTLRVGAFLMLIPSLVLMAFPEPFLRILYGVSYAGGSDIVRFTAPAVFSASFAAFIGYGIAGTGQMKQGLLLNIVFVIPFVIFSIVLIPEWLELGLAFSILAAYIMHSFAALLFARSSWSLDLRLLAPLLLVAAISIPTTAFISLSEGIPRLILALPVIAAVAYSGFSTLSEREKEVLAKPLTKALSRVSK